MVEGFHRRPNRQVRQMAKPQVLTDEVECCLLLEEKVGCEATRMRWNAFALAVTIQTPVINKSYAIN